MFSSMLQRYAATYQGFSKQVWMISTASFFNAMGQIMGMFVSLYMHSLGFSLQSIGIAITTYGFGFLAGSYASGFLCEKIHPKHILSISMLINSFLIAAIVLSTRLNYMLIILAFCGLSTSSVRPASVLLINALVDQSDRARALGLRRVGINLGIGISAMVSGLLASYSYQLIFLFAGFSTLLASLSLLKSQDYQSIQYTQSKHASQSESTRNSNDILKKFWIIAAVYLITVLVFTQMRSTYPIYLKEFYKANPHTFSSLYFLNSLIIIVIEVPLLTYLTKIKQHILAAFGSLFICMGFAILPFSNNPDFIYLSCIFWSLGEILFYPTMLNLMLNTIKSNHARYTGIYQSIYSLAVLLSPVFGTTLYQFHQGEWLWIICGIFGVLTFCKTLRFLR